MSVSKTKKYSKGPVIVVWQPELCIHAGICAQGLPGVFKPKDRPWVDMDGASLEEIQLQAKACPSGALSLASSLEQADELN